MVSLVKDGLLKNLDGYVTAFGWDKWPASELLQDRVAKFYDWVDHSWAQYFFSCSR